MNFHIVCFQEEQKLKLKESLAGLPKPSNDFEIVVPEVCFIPVVLNIFYRWQESKHIAIYDKISMMHIWVAIFRKTNFHCFLSFSPDLRRWKNRRAKISSKMLPISTRVKRRSKKWKVSVARFGDLHCQIRSGKLRHPACFM